MKTHALLWNGRAFEKTAGLPVTDRGFRYGMSVFESFPVREGKAAFLEKHLERLRSACATVGFSLPHGVLEKCGDALAGAESGFGRIYVTAGDGAVTENCDACRVLIFVEEREPAAARVYHRGYDLALHAGEHAPVFPGVKTGNYWANLRAFREGVAAHCNEMLLFNEAGHLVSACMANVFIVSERLVKTPDVSTGARAGVVREWAMSRVETAEALITRAEAEAADEIFLTSSWLGIMPAESIGGRKLDRREIATRLLKEYRDENGG
ncbi:MAG TPA: aminotransferase class IV [Chthoniobacteraceae bacterium]|jgi:branched-subunit amino acid aminotransferase/4-amino-4-deoxychorismate lyase|nr:aminotransferase class IV [Chthoniobacteraceae bacterium]